MAVSTDDVIRVGSTRDNIAIFSSSPLPGTSDFFSDDEHYYETVTNQPLSSGSTIKPNSTTVPTSTTSKVTTARQSLNSTMALQSARSKIFRKSNFVRRPTSPELGRGEWAIDRDARGRPIRTSRAVDTSAKDPAIDSDDEDQDGPPTNSDNEDGEEEHSDTDAFEPDMLRRNPDTFLHGKMKCLAQLFPQRSAETITKAVGSEKGRAGIRGAIEYLAQYENRPSVTRKRKRSESPPALPLDGAGDDAIEIKSEYTDEDATLVNGVESVIQPLSPDHFPLQITVNVPLGQREPIILHLDPKSIVPAPVPPVQKQIKALIVRLPIRPHKMKRVSTRKMELLKTFKKSVGFMDLAPELRNKIYRATLVAKSPLNLGSPTNLSLTAALLRTNRQIHSEARSILYSENHFCIQRRSVRHGSFWNEAWHELGFAPARKFFQIIGPVNISLIRQLSFTLEDALPCMSPHSSTAETRRFVNDDNLISVLRKLGKHGQLRELNLNFRGRRRVDRTDGQFLERMKRVKADSVHFRYWYPGGWQDSGGAYGRQEWCVKNMLQIACERRKKKFY